MDEDINTLLFFCGTNIASGDPNLQPGIVLCHSRGCNVRGWSQIDFECVGVLFLMRNLMLVVVEETSALGAG